MAQFPVLLGLGRACAFVGMPVAGYALPRTLLELGRRRAGVGADTGSPIDLLLVLGCLFTMAAMGGAAQVVLRYRGRWATTCSAFTSGIALVAAAAIDPLIVFGLVPLILGAHLGLGIIGIAVALLLTWHTGRLVGVWTLAHLAAFATLVYWCAVLLDPLMV